MDNNEEEMKNIFGGEFIGGPCNSSASPFNGDLYLEDSTRARCFEDYFDGILPSGQPQEERTQK